MYIFPIKLLLELLRTKFNCSALSKEHLKSINGLSFALLKVEKLLDLFCILCIVKVNRLQAKQLSYWKYLLQGLANSSRGNAEEGRIKLLLSRSYLFFSPDNKDQVTKPWFYPLLSLFRNTQYLLTKSKNLIQINSDNGSLIPWPGLSGHQLPRTSGAASSETEGKRKLIPCCSLVPSSAFCWCLFPRPLSCYFLQRLM